MVLTEVGEDTHGEAYAIDAIQRQGVGGDLHDHVGTAGVGHPAEQLLQLEGLRRGALRVEDFAADHVLNGADQAHLGTGLLLQNALDEVGGGGLAAGAGDADHGHLAGGVIEPVAGDHRQSAAGVLHNYVGNVAVGCMLADNTGRAFFAGHGDEAVAIGLGAGDSHEQPALRRLAGVVADVGDVGVHIGGGGQNSEAL